MAWTPDVYIVHVVPVSKTGHFSLSLWALHTYILHIDGVMSNVRSNSCGHGKLLQGKAGKASKVAAPSAYTILCMCPC